MRTEATTSTYRMRLAAVSGLVLLTGGLALGPAAPARADSSDASIDEHAWCAMNFSCLVVEDARQWATGTAQWLYSDSLHNGAGDAFRHCAWAGAIANRVGYDTAYTQVVVHEDLSADPMEEVTMDIANDLIGLDLGVRSLVEGGDDTWGWILHECAARADGGQLVGGPRRRRQLLGLSLPPPLVNIEAWRQGTSLRAPQSRCYPRRPKNSAPRCGRAWGPLTTCSPAQVCR